MWSRIYSLPVAALLALGFAACDLPTEPAVSDRDGDGISDRVDACPDAAETVNEVFDRDGCPDHERDLYFVVAADVENFWRGYFQAVFGAPYVPVARIHLFTQPVASQCGPIGGPAYCPADLSVYLAEPFMLDQLHRIGDFAPAMIVAHEVAHHVQNLLGLFGILPGIQRELQADCLAGAWSATAAGRGLLDTGDLQEAARSLFEAGDGMGVPWFDPQAHGTGPQRQQAFAFGFTNGASAC